MHVVDLGPVVERLSSRDELIERTSALWGKLYEVMEPTETLWVFAPHIETKARCLPTAMAIGDRAREETDLVLKNVITRYKPPTGEAELANVQEEILFFAKDKRSYFFDKDSIRVDHVYKGNEWGDDRETGTSSYHDAEVQRYNPEGKDPGNVWLEEARNLTDDETLDVTRPLGRMEAVRRVVLAGSTEGEKVCFWIGGSEFSELVEQEGRDPEFKEIEGLSEVYDGSREN